MVFKIGLPDFIAKESADKLQVLQVIPDLRLKALVKFAENTNSFLVKLLNLFFSNSSAL